MGTEFSSWVKAKEAFFGPPFLENPFILLQVHWNKAELNFTKKSIKFDFVRNMVSNSHFYCINFNRTKNFCTF